MAENDYNFALDGTSSDPGFSFALGDDEPAAAPSVKPESAESGQFYDKSNK